LKSQQEKSGKEKAAGVLLKLFPDDFSQGRKIPLFCHQPFSISLILFHPF
jgi:hypothetical protein